ncbi:hypothetical protein CMV_030721 [Castanea mollissima]|uniref:Uncharacterized protein n=1 Tax=Castanea mollissima TaxID=60419 RepID=A0A8J4UXS4_9ROSI|nr:hypothetical protein CMV_030721 [Castanea mollissima]
MEEPTIFELLSVKRGKKKKMTMTIKGVAKKKKDSPVPSVNAENPSRFAENCNGKKVTVLALWRGKGRRWSILYSIWWGTWEFWVLVPKTTRQIFNPDISKAYRNVDFDFHVVNQTVANHFYRQGLFDLGDSILNEAEEPEAIAIRSQFFEMHQILEAVRVGNLEPALKWACIDREKLK